MEITEELIEDALEHLWDFSYLGIHALASLTILQRNLPKGRILTTHLDRGKALHRLLRNAVSKLKLKPSHKRLSKEAMGYAVLYSAYIEKHKNREVARALNISLRTFYRERRRALLVLTRLVNDIESAL